MGLITVVLIELGLITCASIYNPVFAAYRLNAIDPTRRARVLSAWSIGTSLSIAAITVLGGVLAELTTARTAIGLAGVLLLATPLLLPRRFSTPPAAENEPVDLAKGSV
ncbi:hypothetical protein GCM10023318_19610 [Nocardia callitridis]|uniref:Major facilitator superfamily (MFS) profile domain-containing protein n=1 Tax=Nocardia callitridis TaxID=648753 RepID=A0ABP9K4S6_9NOCA